MLLTKFGKHPIKHVEEEAIIVRKKERSQADQPVWVLWSCYVTWTSYSIYSENDLLTPVTPNDPRLTFDPIKSHEGLKLINMYKSYGHAM